MGRPHEREDKVRLGLHKGHFDRKNAPESDYSSFLTGNQAPEGTNGFFFSLYFPINRLI